MGRTRIGLSSFRFFLFVRVEGLEPPCLAASDPKSDTSTNFATPAFGSVYLFVVDLFICLNIRTQSIASNLNESTCLPAGRRINESTNQRINESTNQRINESTSPLGGSKGKVLNIDNEHGKKVLYETKS